MKFGEIFLGEVMIDALKGGGVQTKGKRLYYSQTVKKLKQQVVITNKKINIPVFN